MTSLGWLGWPVAALCLILSSTTVAAASTSSLQSAAPTCPPARGPYDVSYACAQAASAEAIRNVATGVRNEPPAQGGTPVCPPARGPYDVSPACAQAASASGPEGGPAPTPSVTCDTAAVFARAALERDPAPASCSEFVRTYL